MKSTVILCATLLLAAGQGVAPFHRQYREGETVKYHMKGKNEAWQYEIEASGMMKKDAAGAFVEEIGWSDLHSGGAALPIPLESAAFRQELSLDPSFAMRIPDLSRVSPILVGPMLDLMTFYADYWLAAKNGTLMERGNHTYLKVGGTNSWADGSRVILGEDSIDFDLTVKDINQSAQTARLLVRHVPPQEPKVNLPTGWMKKPVADTPNNWVNVERNGDKYIAEVGKETFDVEIVVSLRDGRLLIATLDNPVTAIRRECSDAALTQCSGATPRQILRQIEVRAKESQ